VRVAVLGAGGTIAPAIVRDLAESDEVTELLLLDLDAERALAVAERHGGDKAFARGVDARHGLGEALEDSFVLVNSASYRVNVDAMRACLRAGCHYVDLGGLYHVTEQQLELHAQFETAGLLALLGMGSSPGKTNVMGVQALRELGREPERMDVVAAGRDLDPPDGPSYPYALSTLLDELTIPPMVVRDRRPEEIAPLSPGGEVDVGAPIGPADTIYTLHSEVLTFPDSFGCRACSFRLSLAPAVLERLRALTGAPEPEVERAAREALPPSARTVSVHVVSADDVRVTAVTEPMERWGLGGGIVSTAAPAAAAVRLLERGAIDAAGALPPERCVSPDDLFPELEQRNCRFSIEAKALQ
jgi:lysine 6-dehydrogenase